MTGRNWEPERHSRRSVPRKVSAAESRVELCLSPEAAELLDALAAEAGFTASGFVEELLTLGPRYKAAIKLLLPMVRGPKDHLETAIIAEAARLAE